MANEDTKGIVGSSDLVQKAAPTAGDAAELAASGPNVVVDTKFIPYATPAGEARQQEAQGATSLLGSIFLEPPEDPAMLYQMYQLSAYLAPIMGCLDTNVYKAPYKLKSIIPFDRPDEARQYVHEALLWEKAKGGRGIDFDAQISVSDAEVEQTLERLRQRSILEKNYLNRFFQEAVADMTYRQLCALTGQDYEVTGNAYWEIIRDTHGNISRIKWLPSISMRATRLGTEQIPTTKRVRDGLHWTPTQQIRRFRRYVQLQFGGEAHAISAYFKEFGDPRVMSRRTGKYYSSLAVLATAEGHEQDVARLDTTQVGALAANEVLHFKLLFGGASAYGLPRWAGVYIPLRGSRDLDEENHRIVGDEAVPSLMLLVSGGIIGAKAYNRLKNEIEARKKGRKGIMIVEAVASKNGPVVPNQQPHIDVEKLRSEQTTDMLFQNYDARNEEKADGAWRIPKTVLGKAGANRATSQAERQFAEDQVFAPLRADKDEPINALVLPDLNVTTWMVETQSMQPRDPQQRAEILRILVEAGIITPNEGRELAAPIFAQRLDDLQGLWTMFPPRVLTVLLQTKNAELAATLLGEDKGALARLSNAIRDTLGLGAGGAAVQDIPDVPEGQE